MAVLQLFITLVFVGLSEILCVSSELCLYEMSILSNVGFNGTKQLVPNGLCL